MTIGNIRDKLVRGGAISEGDLLVANAALESASYTEAIDGCHVILVSSEAKDDIDKASLVAGRLSKALIGNTSPEFIELAIMLLALPREKWAEQTAFRDYALWAGSAPDAEFRINATHLLGILASNGDEQAADLLRRACDDFDPTVRENARHLLSTL